MSRLRRPPSTQYAFPYPVLWLACVEQFHAQMCRWCDGSGWLQRELEQRIVERRAEHEATVRRLWAQGTAAK